MFVHVSAPEQSGIEGLTEGQTVVVDVIDGRKGPEATGVRPGLTRGPRSDFLRPLGFADLEITRLRRRDRLEQFAIRLEIEQRCSVQAIQATYCDDCPLDRNQLCDRRADRIWPGR